MKQLARSIVVAILSWQVRRLRRKSSFKIVGVVGSIGKTSTKRAVAEALSAKLRVQYQSGNYNDLVTVPLVLFGHSMPALFNPLGWLRVFVANELQLLRTYPFDVAVLEVGTDGPGQINSFARYLHLDIAVITAVAPEHMEYFKDLDAVAAEELSVARFADKLVVNADLVAAKYRESLAEHSSYALSESADYQASEISYDNGSTSFNVLKHGEVFSQHELTLFSDAHIYSALAAVTVWDILQLPVSELEAGLAKITAVPGRMQLLAGVNGITIIDDSYNASPEATKTALNTLYRLPATSRVALLGNMNELGSFSREAHVEVGDYCDPTQLSEVITLGPDANTYLAEAARQKGCKVTSFDSPYKAGEYLKSIAAEGMLLLVKGSQNKVFAEEAIKSILANPADADKLVRQSKYWLSVKKKQFST